MIVCRCVRTRTISAALQPFVDVWQGIAGKGREGQEYNYESDHEEGQNTDHKNERDPDHQSLSFPLAAFTSSSHSLIRTSYPMSLGL